MTTSPPSASAPEPNQNQQPPAGSPDSSESGEKRRRPAFPESQLQVSALADPVLDNLGHDPRSGYVERYWLSILGPSCLLLLRKLAADLEQNPDGFTVDTAQWAQELGLGMKGGKNGPFWRAIERACRFGAAQRNGELLAVRRRLPPLTARQVERLPPTLQQAHERWAEARLLQPKRGTIAKWSPERDQGVGGQQLGDAA